MLVDLVQKSALDVSHPDRRAWFGDGRVGQSPVRYWEIGEHLYS